MHARFPIPHRWVYSGSAVGLDHTTSMLVTVKDTVIIIVIILRRSNYSYQVTIILFKRFHYSTKQIRQDIFTDPYRPWLVWITSSQRRR